MSGHDAIIIGGGVQGVMAALECVGRGRRPLLVERGRLGEGATGASLGIVHGGLRYLQSLDLARWRRSRAEQMWFAREFPAYVAPLRCVMPLYRGSKRSRALFAAAFAAQRLAGRLTGLGGAPDDTGFLSAAETLAQHPVPAEGLTGGAYWTELALTDPPGLMRAIAARVTAGGGTVLENETAEQLMRRAGRVTGVMTRAAGSHELVRRHAPVVLICAGSGAQALAARFDRKVAKLSAHMLSFNLLLDRALESEAALALSPTPGRGRALFFRPLRGRTLVGTAYAPMSRESAGAAVPQREIMAFLRAIGRAAPALADAPVVSVWSGCLPDEGGARPRLRERDLAWDHGHHGGPRGLVTLSPSKLTTAHAHAREALARLWPEERRNVAPLPTLRAAGEPQWSLG